jgi:hypothetical protein
VSFGRMLAGASVNAPNLRSVEGSMNWAIPGRPASHGWPVPLMRPAPVCGLTGIHGADELTTAGGITQPSQLGADMAGQIAAELWHHQQQQHQLQQHQLQQLQLQYQHKEESAAVKSDIPSMGQSAPAPRLLSEEEKAVYQAAMLQYQYALWQIQNMQSMQNLQGNPYTQVKLILQFPLA